MKLLQLQSLLFVLAVCGVGALLQANTADAATRCVNTPFPGTCTWTPPHGNAHPVRLTVGTDQVGKLRWVASQRNTTQSGLIKNPDYFWIFNGQDPQGDTGTKIFIIH